MSLISVTAITPLTHRGVEMRLGESFLCTPIEAAMLRYRGKVALASDEDRNAKVMQALVEQETPKRRRRSYRRRDLTAESS